MDIALDILSLDQLPFPVLTSISCIPLFAPNGDLDARTSGYHPETLSYCHLDTDLPSVPEKPTPGDVAAARRLLVDDLLVDFRFVDAASRATAVAAFLVLPGRALIPGPVPLHLVEAPAPGAGKTLLMELVSIVATGYPAEVECEAEGKGEWRKKVTAKLLRAPALVLFDNLSGRLDAPALAAALTAEVWSDRVLGSSRQIEVPVRCLWLGTGNNVELSDELARRTVPIRIDPACDQPHLRKNFKHRDLVGWAKANRPWLVWAVLVLWRNWIAQGAPSGTRILGRYEGWSRVLSGVLEMAGIPGLLTDRQTFDSRANAERREWCSFVARWWDRFGDRPVGTGELLLLAREEEALEGVLGGRSRHAQKYSLGKALDSKADRVLGEFRITRETNDYKSRKQYRLHRVSQSSDERRRA
jgi:hypothetical protein